MHFPAHLSIRCDFSNYLIFNIFDYRFAECVRFFIKIALYLFVL